MKERLPNSLLGFMRFDAEELSEVLDLVGVQSVIKPSGAVGGDERLRT